MERLSARSNPPIAESTHPGFAHSGPRSRPPRLLVHRARVRRRMHGFLNPTRPSGGVPLVSLAAQAQSRDQGPISLGVDAPQIVQQSPSLADQLQKSTSGVVILLVRLEVLREFPNAFGQERDLHFRRAGVGLVGAVFAEDLGLLLCRDQIRGLSSRRLVGVGLSEGPTPSKEGAGCPQLPASRRSGWRRRSGRSSMTASRSPLGRSAERRSPGRGGGPSSKSPRASATGIGVP